MKGIYIHVPFCKSKCTYCDFASYPGQIGKSELYFACLYKEMKAKFSQMKDKRFTSVYFGGGTPSFVEPKFIYGAMKLIYNECKISKNAEITLEVNPGTLDESKVKVYKNAGINRFSVGLQSSNDETLQNINRIHTKQDFIKCMYLLKDFNTSVDVMVGLPNETFLDVKNTIDLATSFDNVKHISLYTLKPEEGTPMFTKYLNGELLSDDETAEIYEKSVSYLKEKGFFRYEVSNFSKGEYYSKHNYNYWQRGEYIGFGVSASSFINERRFTNTENIDNYCKCILANKVAEIYSENIEGFERNKEYAMLSLRTANGVNLNDYFKTFNSDFKKDFENAIKNNLSYLDINDKRIKIKDEYLFVQNSILVDFIEWGINERFRSFTRAYGIFNAWRYGKN